MNSAEFTTDCKRCARLVDFLHQVKQQCPDYYCRPVPSFGDLSAQILIVGLAPGMHGANATGRPFTGDYAGILLYETLYKFGLSTAPESKSTDDGLELINCRITNVVRCLPPQNKPVANEVNQCNDFLAHEIQHLPDNAVVIALGGIAHKAILKACGLKQAIFKFSHNKKHILNSKLTMIDSYHCSRYNTQTRRLTPEMFSAVFEQAINEL